MRRLWGWIRRLAGFFNQRRLDQEARDELESHLQMHIEENLRSGMTPEESRRVARLKLGGLEATVELCREQSGLPGLDILFQNLRYGLRMLRRSPTFTAVAIGTLALGIGANTAIFSLVSALLFRPLPFTNPSGLVWISNTNPDAGGIPGLIGTANFRDWRELNTSFGDLAAFVPSFSERREAILTGRGEPTPIKAAYVTQNFLKVLGIQPQLGRSFVAEECKRHGPPAVILTDSLWRRRFQADPGIIGRPANINNQTCSVVGILPTNFDFSSIFRTGSTAIDFLCPYQEVAGFDNWGNMMAVIGRLKLGTALPVAQLELDRLNQHLETAHPERGIISARLTPLRLEISGRFRRPFLILCAAAGGVLLIACANLSNLLLARGATRRKEIAVRAALGASRWRLVQQMLAESALLSVCGALLGLPLAYFATLFIARSDVFNIPLMQTARVDSVAMCFTLGIAFATALLVGIIPALQLSRANVQDALKETNRGSGPGKRLAWMRQALVVSEVALACILLIGAGLLTRSFVRLLDIDLGFSPEQVAAWRILTNRQFTSNDQEAAFYAELIRRIEALPLVESATFPDKLPLELNDVLNVRAKGKVYSPRNIPSVFEGDVDRGYFKTLRIPFRAGRDFDSHDPVFDWTAPGQKVAIVNEKMARAFWPGQDAIGQIVYIDDPAGKPAECRIVGVAADVRQSALEQEAGPAIFVVGRGIGGNLVVRTKGALKALIPMVRATLRQFDINMVVDEAKPLRQIVDRAVAPRRLIVLLLGLFSLLALLLAAVGIYGVIACSVSQRSQEIGIRLALGSSRGAVLRLVLCEGLRVVLAGCAIGLAGSLALTRAMRALLFGVSSTDPLTYLAGGILLLAVALLASWLPARRASRVDPMVALRWE